MYDSIWRFLKLGALIGASHLLLSALSVVIPFTMEISRTGTSGLEPSTFELVLISIFRVLMQPAFSLIDWLQIHPKTIPAWTLVLLLNSLFWGFGSAGLGFPLRRIFARD